MSCILDLNNTIIEASIPLDMLQCMFERTEESVNLNITQSNMLSLKKGGEFLLEKINRASKTVRKINMHIIKS